MLPHDQPAISVVIPAYNESRRIGGTLATVIQYLHRSKRSWELVVVDDGSDDDTAEIARHHGARDARVRIIRLPHNRGKGHAVRAGVLASRGRRVLMSDADLSTPIDDVELLERAMGPGVAAAIGSRALAASQIGERQNRLRETLGRMGNRFIRWLAVPGIADTQCGFKLFDGPCARELFARSRFDGWAFDVEILHLCRRFGWQVAEIPVRWDHVGGSRLRAFAYLQVLRDVVRIRLVHKGTAARSDLVLPVPAVGKG